MTYFITSATVMFVLYVSMIVHEFGHLVAARVAGMPIEKITFGVGRKIGIFPLSGVPCEFFLFPIKGRITFKGEVNVFFEIPLYQRIFFYVGGICASSALTILSAVILVWFLPDASLSALDGKALISHIASGINGRVFLELFFFINLNAVLLNAFPFVYFDGGKIIFSYLERYHPNIIKHYLYVSLILTIILLAAGIVFTLKVVVNI